MKGILFDLDGTLVDTAIDMLQALKLLAAENGINVEPEYHKYKELITYGSRAIVTSIFGELEDSKFTILQKRYLEIYENILVVDSQLFPEVAGVINRLDENKTPWGIVTNKPTYLAKPLLSSLPQLKNCQIILGGGSTHYSKPHPQPLKKAIEYIQIDAAKSWYIGDALSDIQAGNAAGMKTAVAMWGYLRQQDKPQDWQADILLNSVIEILNLN